MFRRGAARRIARCDKADQVRIAPVRSPLGQALLAHYGLNPDDPASWLMVEDGHAYGSLTAILRLGRRLSPAVSALAWLGWLPEAVQDWLYARLA